MSTDLWTPPVDPLAGAIVRSDYIIYSLQNIQALFNGLVGDASADVDIKHTHKSGTLAARPAASTAGRLYYATDIKVQFLDTGAAWVVVGIFPSAARAYNAAAEVIGSGGDTTVLFDSERFDNDTIHNTVTNNGRLTCKTAGIYSIFGALAFASNATGRRHIKIRLNGVTGIAIHEQQASPTFETSLEIATLYQLAINDYVELIAFQDSTVNLSVIFPNFSPEFGMARIGYI